MKRFLWLMLCFILGLTSTAQQLTFQNIGLKEGLSNGVVLDMAIDKQGFVWIATDAGLNRIAGRECTQLKSSNTPLLYNEFTTIYHDKYSDLLLIGYKGTGLSLLNCNTLEIKNITAQDGLEPSGITDITWAADSGAWIAFANGTIMHYNIKRNHLDEKKFTLEKFIRCCLDDGNGHLYIGHSSIGLRIINLKKNKSTLLSHQKGDETSLPGNNVRALYADRMGNLWVGTNQGLGLFNPLTKSFRTFCHSETDPKTIISDNIHHITQTANGQIWIAFDTGGISVLDIKNLQKGEFKNITPTEGLSSLHIRRILQDKYGHIWIGTYGNGVDFINSNPPAFNVLMSDSHQVLSPIYGMDSDSDGNLWLGGESCLWMFHNNLPVRKINLHTYLKRSLAVVYIVHVDSKGNIWLGIEDEGVLVYSPSSERFTHIDVGYDSPDIHALYEDEEGRMWIGSEFGIFSWKDGELSREESLNKAIEHSVVFGIAKDGQGKLWIGTLGKGLYIIDKKGKAKHMTAQSSIGSDNINHILMDSKGGVWIATYNGLIYFKDTQQLKEATKFDEQQGILDSNIRAVQQDRMGNVWVSTYSGIACFDQVKQRFYNYNYQSGIPIGGFVEGSKAMTSDGTLYFGSLNGVCAFNPQMVERKLTVSPIHIINCERYDNTYCIKYTVEDYAQAGEVEYSYQMKGLDDKWFFTGDNNDVIFHNLKPGTYEFTVRAKLWNQEWEDAPQVEMTFVVHPPFWLTWWAKLLYILAVIGIVYYLFRIYMNKLQLRHSLELAQQESLQKQELNEERLRFFTNVTHELRTPLTLIIGPLEDLLGDHRLPEVLHKKVQSIKSSADRLLDLINQILEFRKTETQNRCLTVARGNISALVKEIGEHYKDLNRNPKVTIHVIVNPSIPPVYFDSEVISSIVNNLMSNAVKYTPEGKIHLIMNTNNDGDIEISVMDTGYGISPEALPHIFDRYYQAKGKHQASGTGIGLALVKSLADLHEGKLTVVSKIGKGSKFTFTLNAANIYPQALHKEDEGSENLFAGQSDKTEQASDNEELPLMLVVEDNSDIRQYIQESLCEDYRIIQATNGLEGVNAALEQIPDIIVSDIMMPEMDGVELTKRLKKDIRTSHIPIILLTAKTSVSDQQEGYDSGADSYLTKPFSAGLLLSRVRNLLSARRRLAEILLQNVQVTGTQTTETNGLSENEAETLPIANRLDQEFLDKLNQLIDDNLSVEDLDISYMTDKMAMSRSTLYRKVKALTNISPNEYIRKRKLNVSIDLLKSGENTITEIAYMTGFNSLHHFSHAFKKEFGVSPSEYLRK